MFRGTPEEIASLKVGDVLYNFDGNRRTYEKPEPGRMYASGGPIYEKHFDAVKIEGETKQSWIMRHGVKVNKKTLESSTKFADRGYFTKSGMEADIWLHDHRPKIVREVERTGLEQLREIARIIGYNAGVAR